MFQNSKILFQIPTHLQVVVVRPVVADHHAVVLDLERRQRGDALIGCLDGSACSSRGFFVLLLRREITGTLCFACLEQRKICKTYACSGTGFVVLRGTRGTGGSAERARWRLSARYVVKQHFSAQPRTTRNCSWRHGYTGQPQHRIQRDFGRSASSPFVQPATAHITIDLNCNL